MRRKTQLQIETLEQRLNMAGDMPEIDSPPTTDNTEPAAVIQTAVSSFDQRTDDRLGQLRRLQDLQVTIEVRFITLQDNFFERIGVDFDFDIDDNVNGSLGGTFADDNGPDVVIGRDPGRGLLPADFDAAFSQDGLGADSPFGGFDASSGANFGFAILSDIEVFFMMQAAQQDARTDVMTAPKVTLFNGQQATVSDASQVPFVTSVIPVVG